MADEQSTGEERVSAEALFRVHAPFVASFLHRLGAPAQNIEDIVQEVFIIAHRKGGYVRGPAQPRTWLAAIAVRVAQSSERARSRQARRTRPASGDAIELAQSTDDPHQELETRRAFERLRRALEGLPPEHRAAFMLYEIEGESCESIAAEWQVPVGTIYSRLHSARRRVFEAYPERANAGSNSSQRRQLRHVNGEP